MAALNLHFVDELIELRQKQHGGNRGAPKLVNAGARSGEALNRSCIVMLSAMLQTYVENVFKACAQKALPSLANEATFSKYWQDLRFSGNPNAPNLRKMFLQLGVTDILEGLSWRQCSTEKVVSLLNELVDIRNQIAHGAATLQRRRRKYHLPLKRVKELRNFAAQFAIHFEQHALGLMPKGA